MLDNLSNRYKKDDKFRFNANMSGGILIVIVIFIAIGQYLNAADKRKSIDTSIKSDFFTGTDVSEELQIAGLVNQLNDYKDKQKMGAKLFQKEAAEMKAQIQTLKRENEAKDDKARLHLDQLRTEMEQRLEILQTQNKTSLDELSSRIPENLSALTAQNNLQNQGIVNNPPPIQQRSQQAPVDANPYAQYAEPPQMASSESSILNPLADTGKVNQPVKEKPFNAYVFDGTEVQSLRAEETKDEAQPGTIKPKNQKTAASNDKGEQAVEEPPKPVTYYPSTTVIPAITISGLDAPAGLNSSGDPHPILLRVKKEAILPNKYRASFKECKILATGYGELSTSRAYIRTERLACITVDGGVIDTALNGYVSGEDGKPGLAGDIVNREGAIFLRTGFAGFLEGLAAAFVPQEVPVVADTTNGTTQYNTRGTGDILAVAGFNGLSKSMDKLSDYYLQYLDQLFPVVEIKPNRKVDITLTSGLTLNI